MLLNTVIQFNILISLCSLTSGTPFVVTPPQQANKRDYVPSAISTTNSPDSNIDDPSNAVVSTTTQNRQELCETKCYSKVTEAQKIYAEHLSLMKKEKQLIKRKSNLALGDATDLGRGHRASHSRPRSLGSRSSGSNSDTNNNLSDHNHDHIHAIRSPTIRNRSLSSYDNEQIVVSRLRIARSTNKIEIEPTLEQLRLKREKKFTEACRSLWNVQSCLGEITRTCIGNLQYHTFEVISNQWFEKLNCPPSRNPDFKPFKELLRSVPKYEDDRLEKIPVPRSISSYEETRNKLETMFGKKLGVVLGPTQTKSSTHRLIPSTSPQSLESTSSGTFNGINYKFPNLVKAQVFLIGGILTLMLILMILTGLYFKKPPKI